MFFITKRYKLVESDFFTAFKDYHNHALPAVDDGVKSLDESLQLLSYFEELNISEVVLTPHAMLGMNQSREAVRAAYDTLQSAYQGPIKLSLASEYMLDSAFDAHLSGGDLCFLEDRKLLVETSYYSAPRNLNEVLFNIASEGITPVIAHPERYTYMVHHKYESLKDKGYLLQLNLLSFTNFYGGQVSEKALKLLDNEMYDYVGTDIHNLKVFKSKIEQIKLTSKQLDKLMRIKK